MSHFPTIQFICPVDQMVVQYSTESHFKECEACKKSYELLSKDIKDFSSLFSTVMHWAAISNHVIMIKSSVGRVSLSNYSNFSENTGYGLNLMAFEGQQKLLAHKDYHSRFNAKYIQAMESLTETNANIVAGIMLHMFPALEKK